MELLGSIPPWTPATSARLGPGSSQVLQRSGSKSPSVHDSGREATTSVPPITKDEGPTSEVIIMAHEKRVQMDGYIKTKQDIMERPNGDLRDQIGYQKLFVFCSVFCVLNFDPCHAGPYPQH